MIFLNLLGTPLDAALDNWMHAQARSVPGFEELSITSLAIPGTHDSLTFRVHKQKQSNDKIGFLARVPVVGKAISQQAQTQSSDLKEQFNKGARYFDFRIILTKNGFEGEHQFLNGIIKPDLIELKNLLNKKPGEFIILDFQSVRSMDPKVSPKILFEKLFKEILEIFGDTIYTNASKITVSYKDFIAQGKRVIILSPKPQGPFAGSNLSFTRERKIRSTWHNQSDFNKLEKAITDQQSKEKENRGYFNVIQGQTTPTASDFISNVTKSIIPTIQNKNQISRAKQDLKGQLKFISKIDEKLINIVNIFITDDIQQEFSQKIISLNVKKAGLLKLQNG